MSDPRRSLPALGRLVHHPAVVEMIAEHGRERVVAALRATLADARAAIVEADNPAAEGDAVAGHNAGGSGSTIGPTGGSIGADDLVASAIARMGRQPAQRLTPVINATGVLLHTNLGRAPLSTAAVAAVTEAAGSVDLELHLETGERGGRDDPVRDALVRLTGAGSAFAVNNGAAALILALAALAGDGGVAVSRGELVEIGGSFRIPDIVRSAGTQLVEVGTTNRTQRRDYRAALDAGASAILRVHPSNFRMDGFVHRPSTAELVEVANDARVPFIDDLGSGLLRPHPAASGEPVAAERVAAGVSVVVFSGDKLLGGPQAGVIAGRADLVERCRRAPLARALRLDKLRLAALAATLAAYESGTADQLPVWKMAEAEVTTLRARAEALAAACDGEVVEVAAVLGGGSAPGATLPSAGVAVPGDADRLARLLRTGTPSVVPRIADGRVILDLRSVPPDADDRLRTAVRAAVASLSTTS